MKMKPLFALAIASLLFVSCEKEKEERYNKETIINFSMDLGFIAETEAGVVRAPLDNFDITNYAVDSVAFSCYLYTPNPAVKTIVELYDVKNNRAMSSSILSGGTNTNAYGELKTTNVNFLYEFPQGPTVLAVRCRTEKQGTPGVIFRPTLKLYRK